MMTVLIQDALAQPVFDALTIQLEDSADGDPAKLAREALETAVSQVLGTSAVGWQIKPVHESVHGAFDLLPPADQAILVQQGFQLKYRLEEQDNIAYADVLFETNLDDIPEDISLEVDTGALAGPGGNWWGNLTVTEQDPMWSLRLIEADKAWNDSRGANIVVGHPDSGYIPHPELDDTRILHAFERDIYEGDANAQNPPMRITKKGPPVFFSRSGPRRVRDAIYHAIDSNCHVISMSLGGLGDRSLRQAIQAAVRQNIIVLAAAGNVVRIVVWPARYPEAIAVAACTADRKRWFHSSRGPTVDVTAPGHNVWRAYINENGNLDARPSSGTSYAVATAAGVAVLWLAFHGRDNLLQKYQDVPLQEVFRKVLTKSCDPPPEDHHGQFGSGIINGRSVLEAALPPEDEISQDILDGSLAAGPEQEKGAGKIAVAFDTVSTDDVRAGLSEMWEQLPEDELDTRLEGMEDELLFHIMTNPGLRNAFVSVEEAPPAIGDDFALDGPLMDADAKAISKSLHEQLLAVPGSIAGRAGVVQQPAPANRRTAPMSGEQGCSRPA
jgi:thermitase